MQDAQTQHGAEKHKKNHSSSMRPVTLCKEKTEPKVASIRQLAKMCSIIKNECAAFSNI